MDVIQRYVSPLSLGSHISVKTQRDSQIIMLLCQKKKKLPYRLDLDVLILRAR